MMRTFLFVCVSSRQDERKLGEDGEEKENENDRLPRLGTNQNLGAHHGLLCHHWALRLCLGTRSRETVGFVDELTHVHDRTTPAVDRIAYLGTVDRAGFL